MIINPAQPNSLEWLQARCGVVTASEFDNIVTGDFKARTGEMPKSYLARKFAEKWLGSPLAGFQSVDMDIGTILEGEVIPFYELETGQTVTRIGLLTNDEGTIGCSPDGLLGEDSGIEIKCPRPETHVKYLLNGTLPKEYAPQVHGAMFVTGRPRWVFMSYCRRFPPFILTVERDEEIIQMLYDSIGDFVADVELAYLSLCKLNDGPPARTPMLQYVPKPKPTLHELEIIP